MQNKIIKHSWKKRFFCGLSCFSQILDAMLATWLNMYQLWILWPPWLTLASGNWVFSRTYGVFSRTGASRSGYLLLTSSCISVRACVQCWLSMHQLWVQNSLEPPWPWHQVFSLHLLFFWDPLYTEAASPDRCISGTLVLYTYHHVYHTNWTVWLWQLIRSEKQAMQPRRVGWSWHQARLLQYQSSCGSRAEVSL